MKSQRRASSFTGFAAPAHRACARSKSAISTTLGWSFKRSLEDAALARRLGALCDARHIFFCAVDQPENSSYAHLALVRAGSLTLAIGTEGRAPALGRRLREELARVLSEAGAAEEVDRLAALRASNARRRSPRSARPRRRRRPLHRRTEVPQRLGLRTKTLPSPPAQLARTSQDNNAFRRGGTLRGGTLRGGRLRGGMPGGGTLRGGTLRGGDAPVHAGSERTQENREMRLYQMVLVSALGFDSDVFLGSGGDAELASGATRSAQLGALRLKVSRSLLRSNDAWRSGLRCRSTHLTAERAAAAS